MCSSQMCSIRIIQEIVRNANYCSHSPTKPNESETLGVSRDGREAAERRYGRQLRDLWPSRAEFRFWKRTMKRLNGCSWLDMGKILVQLSQKSRIKICLFVFFNTQVIYTHHLHLNSSITLTNVTSLRDEMRAKDVQYSHSLIIKKKKFLQFTIAVLTQSYQNIPRIKMFM